MQQPGQSCETLQHVQAQLEAAAWALEEGLQLAAQHWASHLGSTGRLKGLKELEVLYKRLCKRMAKLRAPREVSISC